MSTMNISTAYLYSCLSRPAASLQAQLAQAGAEASTGSYADLGLHLGVQTGFETALRNRVRELDAFTSANSLVSTRLDSTQSTLDDVRTAAQQIVTNITSWLGSGGAGLSLQEIGSNGLSALASVVNTSVGGQYLWGGEMTQSAPLKDDFAAGSSAARAAIDAAFQSTFGFAASDPQAATISDSAMQSFLDGAFAAQFQDAGWKANWSNSSDMNPAIRVSPEQTIHTDANANAPGLRKLAQAYAMMAAFGSTQLSGTVRQMVAREAASLVSAGMSSLDKVAAGLGAAQQRLDQANQAMSHQSNLISSQIGALDNVDIAKASVRINMLTTQIQTAYSLTSRLRSLSLSQYLSG